MHTLSNLRWLLVNGDNDSRSFIIHSDIIGVIANFFNSLSGNLFEVDITISTDLSENHTNRIFYSTLACNFGIGIFL